MTEDTPATVDRVVRDRRTVKVFADAPLDLATDRAAVEALLAAAAWAPFHRPAARVHLEGSALASVVPWRFHVVDAAGCRRLREALLADGDKTKVPAMLAAATAVALATWLPDPPRSPGAVPPGCAFEPTAENMEHVAAASAAIQNFLLAATARGIPNYWSSGGPLAGPAVFGRLGIPGREILLGAVFLFPVGSDTPGVATGKLRDRRGAIADWSRWAQA